MEEVTSACDVGGGEERALNPRAPVGLTYTPLDKGSPCAPYREA